MTEVREETATYEASSIEAREAIEAPLVAFVSSLA
jgi:hypothetical protein